MLDLQMQPSKASGAAALPALEAPAPAPALAAPVLAALADGEPAHEAAPETEALTARDPGRAAFSSEATHGPAAEPAHGPPHGSALAATNRVEHTSEEYEAAAFAALTAGCGKGAAGRGAAGRGGGAKKRPASAAAGAASDTMGWVTLDIGRPNPSEASKYSSRGSYTSKYSHEARKAARSKGYSDKDVKEMASAAYKAAAEVWDKM